MAEFNLLDDSGNTLPRAGWVASADSAEVAGENGAAANAIDGNTARSGTRSGRPRARRTRTGSASTWAPRRAWAASATCRAGASVNGTIALFRFYVSQRRRQLGRAGGHRRLPHLGATAAEKTVLFTIADAQPRADCCSTPAAQSSTQGQAARWRCRPATPTATR